MPKGAEGSRGSLSICAGRPSVHIVTCASAHMATCAVSVHIATYRCGVTGLKSVFFCCFVTAALICSPQVALGCSWCTWHSSTPLYVGVRSWSCAGLGRIFVAQRLVMFGRPLQFRNSAGGWDGVNATIRLTALVAHAWEL